MTKEEAIANLKMISVAFVEPVTKEQRKLIDDTFDVAIEALEQEPILDKIKTEIEQLPSYVAKFAGGAFAIHIDKEKVLQIIDKCRTEVDCHSCKTEYDCYECEKYTESEES